MRVLAEATAGDSDAAGVVDRAIEGRAYTIANYVALLDPAAIVLSGGLAEDIRPFLEQLRRRAAELSRAEPQILLAELGSIGGLIGASMAALTILRTTGGQQATSEVRGSEGRALTAMGTTRPDFSEQPATDLVREWSEPDELAREIAESPEAVRRTLSELHRSNHRIVEVLAGTHHVILLGTGASLAMARCAEALWRISDQTTGVPRKVMAVEASEALFARNRDLTDEHAAVVVVSKSGRSPESLAAAEVARRAGARVIAITSDGGSPLADAASDVVVTSIGHEHGAATKSETAALAALLVLGGVIESDAGAADRVAAVLLDAVADASGIAAAGAAVGTARRIWTVGFGASRAVAEALALLLHEKAQLAAVAGTPSGFRHGLVEAGASGDSVVVIECGHEDPLLTAYLDRLADEGQRVGLRMVWLARQDRVGLNIPLRGSTQAEGALEAVVRAQQMAHAAAHAAGTYTDGFRVLRAIVAPGDAFA
jgi:glucosamine--fructose-6-phosphate aminotransferase (isomerizing)